MGNGNLDLYIVKPIYNEMPSLRPRARKSGLAAEHESRQSGYGYIGNDNGPSQFKCDSVSRFQRLMDPRSGEEVDCSDGPLFLISFVWRLMCRLRFRAQTRN